MEGGAYSTTVLEERDRKARVSKARGSAATVRVHINNSMDVRMGEGIEDTNIIPLQEAVAASLSGRRKWESSKDSRWAHLE